MSKTEVFMALYYLAGGGITCVMSILTLWTLRRETQYLERRRKLQTILYRSSFFGLYTCGGSLLFLVFKRSLNDHTLQFVPFYLVSVAVLSLYCHVGSGRNLVQLSLAENRYLRRSILLSACFVLWSTMTGVLSFYQGTFLLITGKVGSASTAAIGVLCLIFAFTLGLAPDLYLRSLRKRLRQQRT